MQQQQQQQRRKQTFSRRKACRFCSDKSQFVDYKEIKTLRHFVTDQGKIIPRRIFGTCAKHQRQIMRAVKVNRNLSLMSYSG